MAGTTAIDQQGSPRHSNPAPQIRHSWLITCLLGVQGVYYLLTGLWPLVSIETFQWVTGPKTDNLPTGRESDHWLVMTVGVLVTAIGLTLLVGAWRRGRASELAILALASALGLTAIDVIYVIREVIPPIYLADAAAESILIAVWVVALKRGLRPEEAA
ncbi:MAG: hypothetical protein ACJ8FY_10015 [Gemmataceae bacterium]